MKDNPTLLCPECHIGHLQRESRPYTRLVDGMLLSVPDMPAVTCDVCGYQIYDQEGLTHVEALLGHVGSRVRSGRAVTKVSPPDPKPSQRLKP